MLPCFFPVFFLIFLLLFPHSCLFNPPPSPILLSSYLIFFLPLFHSFYILFCFLPVLQPSFFLFLHFKFTFFSSVFFFSVLFSHTFTISLFILSCFPSILSFIFFLLLPHSRLFSPSLLRILLSSYLFSFLPFSLSLFLHLILFPYCYLFFFFLLLHFNFTSFSSLILFSSFFFPLFLCFLLSA